MNSRKRIKFFTIHLCLMIGVILPLSGCIVTSAVYCAGITRFEVFRKPQRVLVSHNNQAIAVEVEAFILQPGENGKIVNGRIDGQTTTTFFATHPLRRRYLVADRATIEKEIKLYVSIVKMSSEPASNSDVILFYPAANLPKSGKTARHAWNVIPTEMDAPSAELKDLPASFSSGYAEYPAHKLVPWKSDDGKVWQLSIKGSQNPRADRPWHFYDLFYPVYLAGDIILLPVGFILLCHYGV